MSVERENAVINNQIILRNNFRFAQTGDYFDPYQISKVEILDSNGTTVLETITGTGIVKDAVGKYRVTASAIATAKTIYDKWYFTPAPGASEITKTNTCIVWETAAGPGGLTTLNNLREFLKKETADTIDDPLLQKIISRVSDQIEKKCNRKFSIATVTEYYKGDGTNRLFVRKPPINSITSIHIDSDRVWGSDTQVDASDIIISDEIEGLIILEDDYFDKDENIENVKVVYSGGYSTIPNDLEQACIRLCAAEYIESGVAINAPAKGILDIQQIKKDAWDYILNNYRIMPL